MFTSTERKMRIYVKSWWCDRYVYPPSSIAFLAYYSMSSITSQQSCSTSSTCTQMTHISMRITVSMLIYTTQYNTIQYNTIQYNTTSGNNAAKSVTNIIITGQSLSGTLLHLPKYRYTQHINDVIWFNSLMHHITSHHTTSQSRTYTWCTYHSQDTSTERSAPSNLCCSIVSLPPLKACLFILSLI